jgi:hypothetical protein
MKAVGVKYGLDFDVSRGKDGSSYSPLDDVISGHFTECELFGNAYYIAFSVSGSDGNPVGVHAVGILGLDGQCFLFDPNIGEHKILDVDKFLKSYKACYSTSPLAWNLAKSLAYSYFVQN